MTNFERIHHFFQDFESPEHFITIDWLYCIATCLGRRVCLQEGMAIFPNEFFVIVGPPAVGKSLPARKLTSELRSLMIPDGGGKPKPLVNVVASSVTLERLYQVLESYSEVMTKGFDGKPMIHTTGSFCLADEMGLLFRKKEQIADLVNFLISGYDCTEKMDYDTKQNGTNTLLNVCVNFFGCCTPTWVDSNLPESILDLGIGSRILFVWGDKVRKRTTLLSFDESQHKAMVEVKQWFRELSKVQGVMKFEKEAFEFYDNWVQKEQDKYKVNSDGKLQYYYSRKKIHWLKLAMLFHFSEKMDLVLTLDELKKALEFLCLLEVDMHKALSGVNNNPTATLAENIKRAIDHNKGMKKIAIIAQFYSQAMGGMEEIDAALGYLQTVQQCFLNPNTQMWEMVKPAQKLEGS